MPDRFPLPTVAEDARIVEPDALDDAEVEHFVRRIPEVIETLGEACRAMDAICHALRFPIVSGEEMPRYIHQRNLDDLRWTLWGVKGRIQQIEEHVHAGRTDELS